MQTLSILFRNAFFGVASSLLYRLTNSLLLIYIVQSLGVDKAGVYTIGLSYFLLSSRFALWGLDHLLTREVAKDQSIASLYLTNFLVIRVGLAILSIAIMMGIVQAISYSSETTLVVGIMLLSVLPENINNLCWAGFAAFEEYQFTSIGAFIGSAIKVGLGFFMIGQGYDLVAIAIVLVVGNLFTMSVNLFLVKRRYVKRWHRIEVDFIRRQIPIAFPFIFISFFYILDNRLDNIVLSIVNDEHEVGLYAAATAVFFASGVLSQGYRIAILPIMVRYRRDTPNAIQNLYHQSFKYLVILAIPLATATFLLAEELIILLYRQDLPAAVPALQVLSVAILFLFINTANNRLLVTYDSQGLIARILAIAAVINIAANLTLAGDLGAVGAAIARVLSISAIFLITTLAIRRIVPGLEHFRYLWRPSVAAALMALVIWQTSVFGIWVQIIAGALAYLIGLLALGTFTRSERVTFCAAVKRGRQKTQG
jgi:O-antigen/teichoic acid export membrane protein